MRISAYVDIPKLIDSPQEVSVSFPGVTSGDVIILGFPIPPGIAALGWVGSDGKVIIRFYPTGTPFNGDKAAITIVAIRATGST